jgi:hypothetical protein
MAVPKDPISLPAEQPWMKWTSEEREKAFDEWV